MIARTTLGFFPLIGKGTRAPELKELQSIKKRVIKQTEYSVLTSLLKQRFNHELYLDLDCH